MLKEYAPPHPAILQDQEFPTSVDNRRMAVYDKALGRLLAVDLSAWAAFALFMFVGSIVVGDGHTHWLTIVAGLPVGLFVVYMLTLMMCFVATTIVHGAILTIRRKRDFASEENRLKNIKSAICIHTLIVISPFVYSVMQYRSR